MIYLVQACSKSCAQYFDTWANGVRITVSHPGIFYTAICSSAFPWQSDGFAYRYIYGLVLSHPPINIYFKNLETGNFDLIRSFNFTAEQRTPPTAECFPWEGYEGNFGWGGDTYCCQSDPAVSYDARQHIGLTFTDYRYSCDGIVDGSSNVIPLRGYPFYADVNYDYFFPFFEFYSADPSSPYYFDTSHYNGLLASSISGMNCVRHKATSGDKSLVKSEVISAENVHKYYDAYAGGFVVKVTMGYYSQSDAVLGTYNNPPPLAPGEPASYTYCGQQRLVFNVQFTIENTERADMPEGWIKSGDYAHEEPLFSVPVENSTDATRIDNGAVNIITYLQHGVNEGSDIANCADRTTTIGTFIRKAIDDTTHIPLHDFTSSCTGASGPA